MNAAQVLSRFWAGELPIQPEIIAQRMKVLVWGDPNPEGIVQLKEEGIFQIRFCTEQNVIRKRYAIAHALGHIALGHLSKDNSSILETADNYHTTQDSAQEQQANDFALKLLMPEDAVNWAVQDGRWRSLDLLSSLFGVSTAAMAHRLKQLRLI